MTPNRLIPAALACLLVLSIAGCRQPDTTPPDAVFSQPGVVFTLSPPEAPDCRPDTLYAGTVSWSVAGGGGRRFAIHVGSPGGPEFLRTAEPRGRQETGEWIHPGAWFVLLDARSDQVLATLRAGPEPCP